MPKHFRPISPVSATGSVGRREVVGRNPEIPINPSGNVTNLVFGHQRYPTRLPIQVNRYREGKRPIFLALGPAWTGLDLADKTADAHNDFLLSDLVIGCSPIGLNQSPTMMRRKEYANMLPVIKEALMVFKQGIGRLIRRNGVTDRRLWIMDGRIFSDWKAMAGYTNGTKRLLQRYKNQANFG